MTPKNIDKTFKNLMDGVKKFLDPEWEENLNPETESENEASDPTSEFRVNEAVGKKVKAIINDFIEAAPLIEAAGFRISTLEIELSVIPKLIPHFEKIKDIDDATRAQIIEQVQQKRIIRLLLKALYKADNFQQSLQMGSLEFCGIEIEVTAIPAIRLIYKNPFSNKEPSNDDGVTTIDLVE